MAMENQVKVVKVVLIILVVFVVLCAIYLIASLISDYKKENKRVKEIIEKNKRKMSMDEDEDELQMAYATCKNITPTQRQLDDGEFYSYPRHFTDTGRRYLKNYNTEDNTKGDSNFVIIKSVIYTETREELV